LLLFFFTLPCFSLLSFNSSFYGPVSKELRDPFEEHED